MPLEVDPVSATVHQWTSSVNSNSSQGSHSQITKNLKSPQLETAAVVSTQEHFNDALNSYERELAGKEKVLSKGHPSTLETVHNIAVVFYKQGHYNNALEWYERA